VDPLVGAGAATTVQLQTTTLLKKKKGSSLRKLSLHKNGCCKGVVRNVEMQLRAEAKPVPAIELGLWLQRKIPPGKGMSPLQKIVVVKGESNKVKF